MKLIERYIFMRAATAFLMTVTILTAIVWLTQALRDMDLVTAKGQTILIFISMTSLVLPTLVMVIAPFAVLIAVAVTLNNLNADSELVVINATSAPPWVVVKPIIILGLVATLTGGFLSLYAAPQALTSLRVFITQVRADLVANIVKEGIFSEIEDGMTFHIQKREPNGIMRGLFLSDERDPKKHIVYSSEFAQIVETPQATFLRMEQGTIQQQQIKAADDGELDETNPDFTTVNIINFDSYAIDLSKFTGVSEGGVQYYKPRELTTTTLLNPPKDDPTIKREPGVARSELHDRFTNPLYNLVFATIVAAFLAQVRTTRERRGSAIFVAVILVAAIRLAGFGITSLAIRSPLAVPFMYALPIISIILGLWMVLSGRRLTAMDNLIRIMELFNDSILHKVKGLFRKPKPEKRFLES
ncbi:lipopolysaccharide export system permease protein [Cohaesibacter marisflavi]|uniref:Lipopolysaccharide export system permease protein n=1 Tax=Cohaesibacter marisflavi TaxID=655353 RepID=A0A1I5FX48_9HYPH|nr:LPS export ABC transporter permease LptF [Cohaesibacter marisflavi]SFO27781.1 lipopolysaccharide export system permease protein [Cohaesibacter marisflavi]